MYSGTKHKQIYSKIGVIFLFSAELLRESALGTLQLSGVTVERIIHFFLRIQCYSAPGINHCDSQNLNHLAAKKNRAMDAT